MRNIYWGRVILAVIAAEAVPILLLILLVAAWGPTDQAGAQEFAARLGQWVGPVGGGVMCFLAALWVARKPEQRRVLHGGMVGVGAAMLDVGLLAAGGAAFAWLFVASNAGRVLAGILGGLTGNALQRRTSPFRGS